MPSPAADPFLHQRVASRRDTPFQRKFRRLAPMPVGCVFIAWDGCTDDDVRTHLRAMKDCGFTCLKGTMPSDSMPNQRILELAVNEGIWPYWYAEGGFEDITPDLLRRLGLPADLDIDAALEHPKVIEHQKTVMRRRIANSAKRQHVATTAVVESHGAGKKKSPEWMVPSVVGQFRGHHLAEAEIPEFIAWCQKTYADLDAFKKAWSFGHFEPGTSARIRTWDDVAVLLRDEGYPSKDYAHLRDFMRFHTVVHGDRNIARAGAAAKAFDPEEPIRAGGEAGLFLPFAAFGVDMEGIADRVAESGSFYPSMHLAWHYEEVGFEVARPVYLQASLAADWAKGVWSATWESTGGPQYFSGGKAPFVPEVRDRFPGFTVDGGCMTQLMLSYLAAGFRGFGFWAWNQRPAGWEGGEYGLVDRNGVPRERAKVVGALGQAARRHRRELWQAFKEPLVGVVYDWDNEAIWAAMAITGRDKYRHVPMKARVGAGRALIDANIPFEHVTPRDLDAGLAARYRVLLLPAFIALSAKMLAHLHRFVEAGGRVVLDLPGAYYNEYGHVLPTGDGSDFARLFGCTLDDFGFANPDAHTDDAIGGAACGGFMLEATPTTGTVLARYDRSAKPAVIEHRLGKGSAVLLGSQASLDCFKPGNAGAQALLTKHVLGGLESPYACGECIVYRTCAPTADHYFLVNDGDETLARLTVRDRTYVAATDAVSGEAVDLAAIRVPARSGRWVRAARV